MSDQPLPEKCATCPVRQHGAPFCWRDLQEQMTLLDEHGVQHHLRPGEVLCRQGEAAEGWWIVRRGQILEYMVDAGGREQIIRFGPVGSVVGLCGMGPSGAHWASARAGRRGAEVFFVPREMGRRLVEKNPVLGYSLLTGMAEEVRSAYHKMHGLVMRPARASIAYILLSTTECTPDGQSVVTLTRGEIAAMTGVAVETVVRTLNDFRTQGLIQDVGQHRIELLNPCSLHEVAEGLEER